VTRRVAIRALQSGASNNQHRLPGADPRLERITGFDWKAARSKTDPNPVASCMMRPMRFLCVWPDTIHSGTTKRSIHVDVTF